MGGCYSNNTEEAMKNAALVDQGPFDNIPEVDQTSISQRQEAITQCFHHRKNIIEVNPDNNDRFDAAFRCSLTNLM